jgi:malQ: 4-alpha-glucanotransferase
MAASGGTAVSRTWQDILMLTASTTYWASSVSGRFR